VGWLKHDARAVALAVMVGTLLTGRPWAIAAAEFRGKVVGITDGDTLSVLRDGRAVTVRLQDIDAPEGRQPFGARAKQYASSLAFGQVVTVHVKGQDRNARLLADVILPDERNLSHELIRAGFAWWFRRYSKDATLEALEAEARSTRTPCRRGSGGRPSIIGREHLSAEEHREAIPFSLPLRQDGGLQRSCQPTDVISALKAAFVLQWVCRKILFCCAANVASVHLAAGGRRLSG
jgi:endonuclease YncB( thermonuclease family)